MKVYFLLYVTIAFLMTGCFNTQNCVDNINKLPMYGNTRKCNSQIEADKIFLKRCDKDFKNRKDAAKHMIMRGWQYYRLNKTDTAIMRFNQAWLLDSLNADIYWGFGNLLGLQGKFKDSISFFEKCLRLNPNNASAWNDASVSYGNSFIKSNDKEQLNAAIIALKKAIALDPKNPRFYGGLTSAYCYFVQKDSARKYYKITEQLDPNALNPEVKKFLSNK